MKRFTLLLIVGFLIGQTVQAQGTNSCGKEWSEWRTAWNFPNGRVLYRLEFPSKKCGCGYSYVQMQHDLPYKATVAIRLEGFDCDGKKYGERFTKDIANGEISSKGNDHHWFGSMPSPVSIEVSYEQGGKRIKLVGDQSGTRTYINGVSEQAYYQQQQQKASSGSSSPGGSSRKVVPGTAMPTIVFPADGGSSGNSGGSSGTKNNGTNGNNGASSNRTTPNQQGVRTTATTGTSGTTRQSSNQPKKSPVTTQQDIYKNTALADLQRSQQPGQSSITQAMHLSNAMITAQASGDAATIQQVQQMRAQATVQNQQQMAESITGLTSSMVNLFSVIQNEKREKEAALQRSMNEYNQREQKKNRLIEEVEREMLPVKQRSLQLLQERMGVESNAYGSATLASDKLSYALSWLWKWYESEKILTSKPKVEAPSYTSGEARLIDKGYLTPAEQSILPARLLTASLKFQDFKTLVWVSDIKNANSLYGGDVPLKSKKNWRTEYDFSREVKYSSKIPTAERIDRYYTELKKEFGDDYYSKDRYFKKSNEDKIRSLLDPVQSMRTWIAQDYKPDSATCVRDGEKVYRYWKGKKGWKYMYQAGFTPQKKLECQLLEATLRLDSAILFQRVEALPRVVSLYSDAFEWYFNGPIRWLKLQYQPASFIREAMWRYALAVFTLRQNLPAAIGPQDPHASITTGFVKHFEQYCQSGISRVTEPMKLKD